MEAANVIEITHHAGWVLLFFLIGYAIIIIEELVHFNKASTAILMAIGCWTILFLEPAESVEKHLYIFTFQMFKVSQVIFFLLGALIIVEIINVHQGFRLITKNLIFTSKRAMLWAVCLVTFFLSSVLDNLTSTIVMLSLVAKIVDTREERLLLGGAIVIAANSGGAWTPIGDVATTLLWINGQISSFAIIKGLFLPSLIGLVASLLWLSFQLKGNFASKQIELEETKPGGTLILILGICALIFVPIFKILTGLPPFMGMMFALGILWVVTDLMHYKYNEREYLRVTSILPKINMAIILFYLGVLLSINALESAGILKSLSIWLNERITALWIMPILIGLVSSVVDNVSLVAAIIGMYDLSFFPKDSSFWIEVAYCAGTGGSILIIGSAAGVALMAIEQVSFLWYTKKITIPALLAYFVGLGVYFLFSSVSKVIA